MKRVNEYVVVNTTANHIHSLHDSKSKAQEMAMSLNKMQTGMVYRIKKFVPDYESVVVENIGKGIFSFSSIG